MARRPDVSEFDQPLNRDELVQLHRKLAQLSPHHVARTYREAYERCRLSGELLPKASALQELVTAWKVLREWKRKAPDRND